MSAASRRDEWDELVQAVQACARRMFGVHAVGVTLRLADGRKANLPIPAHQSATPTAEQPARILDAWASGSEPKHSDDFSQVYWPGLGKFAVDAIYARDYPQVQGVVLLIAAGFVLVNLLVDVIYVFLDPRIRYQ